MRKILKWLFLAAFVAGLGAAGSYAGARLNAGKLLGSKPPLTGRTVQFAFEGVPDLPGTPRAWIFTYPVSRLPGVRSATIYVSITGGIIATKPANLDQLIDVWERSQEP